MSTQHTPGPWHHAIDYRVQNAAFSVSISPAWDAHPIAFVMFDPAGSDDLAEARNNARLIAAAPELLSALEQVVTRAESALLGGNPIPTEWVPAARAVLNKAKGTR